MKRGTYVRIEKLGATLYGAPACPMPLYTPGAPNYEPFLSMPNGWWMEGYLLNDLRKGRRIRMDRRVRQGVVARGTFESSRIVGVLENRVVTINSVWVVRRVPVLQPMEEKE